MVNVVNVVNVVNYMKLCCIYLYFVNNNKKIK